MAVPYLPTASLDTLWLRSQALAAVRAFFHAHGYWEVETPILSHDTAVDLHLEPFVIQREPTTHVTQQEAGVSSGKELYLQTSPEFGMKRLLAAGARTIYQITRAFRCDEVGRHHNPEFTMVEWYRVEDTHDDQMDFVEQLVCHVSREVAELRRPSDVSSGEPIDSDSALTRPFCRLTYDEAFERHAGTRVLTLSPTELAELARRHQVAVPPSLSADDADEWMNLLLADLVAPNLGRPNPEFLCDYPASQAALAKVRGGSLPVAERFELYMRGIEICNGYHELTDAAELRVRIRAQTAARSSAGRRPLPQDNRLLDAMEAGLPPCAGVALGFDRLLMLALGLPSIADVLAFPFDRA